MPEDLNAMATFAAVAEARGDAVARGEFVAVLQEFCAPFQGTSCSTRSAAMPRPRSAH